MNAHADIGSAATATAVNTGQPFTTPGWSVERFAEFWANPDPALVPLVVTPDVIGWWPGSDEPVRGVKAYTKALVDIIALIPNLRLRVAEHATNGQFVFVRWIMSATGAAGPFELSGIDRMRLRGGLVAENVIRFDTAHLQRLLGG